MCHFNLFKSRCRVCLGIVLVALGSLLVSVIRQTSNSSERDELESTLQQALGPDDVSVVKSSIRAAKRSSPSNVSEIIEFRDWMEEFSLLSQDSRVHPQYITDGLKLAKARRPQVESLIREDPQRALDEAIRFDQWILLPDVIKAEVERPFSVEGS